MGGAGGDTATAGRRLPGVPGEVTPPHRGHSSASRLPPAPARDVLSIPPGLACPLPPPPAHLSPRLQRMAKSSEKPRLRQIPSSEDMEAEGTLPEATAEGGDPTRTRVEPPRPGSSGKEPERTQKMGQPQEELVLQQVREGWGALGRGGDTGTQLTGTGAELRPPLVSAQLGIVPKLLGIVPTLLNIVPKLPDFVPKSPDLVPTSLLSLRG